MRHIQALEYQEGNMALTSGSVVYPKIVSCTADGAITVKRLSTDTGTSYSMTAGMDRVFNNYYSITVTSGTFDVNQ